MKKRSLVLSFAVPAVFIVLIVLFMPIQYATNDDSYILSCWAGYLTGRPTAYELQFSTIGLGFIISRLFMLFPMFPWYFFMHLFVLWVSACVICFCIFNTEVYTKRAFIISSAGVVCFLSAIASYATIMLQFTTTPAMAGGAAIVLLLYYKGGGRRFFIITLLVLTLLIGFSYSIRPNSFYMCAPLFLSIAVVRFLRCREWRRHIAMMVVIPFAAVAVLYGVNAAAYNTPEYKAFKEFNSARARFTDYSKPKFNEAPEVYTNAGLNATEANLVNRWYFLFDKVNITMFQKLNEGVAEYYKKHPEKNPVLIDRTYSGYTKLIRKSKFHLYSFFVIFFSAVLVLAAPVKFKKDMNGNSFLVKQFMLNSDKIIAGGILTFFFLSNIYFTAIGRFPDRVYFALVYLSAPSLLLLSVKVFLSGGALPYTQSQKSLRSFAYLRFILIWGIALSVVVSSALAVCSIKPSVLWKRKSTRELSSQLAYEYAIAHPDNFYVAYVLNGAVLNPFITFQDKKPFNMIMTASAVFSPLYYRQLELNGFEKVSQSLLLDNRTYFLTTRLPKVLIKYYREQYPEYKFVRVERLEDSISVFKLTPPKKKSKKSGVKKPQKII